MQYLCFSKNYRLVDNERIYQIMMEDSPSDYSKFVFRPIIDSDNKEFQKTAYLSLMHCESMLYVGCRKETIGIDYRKFLTSSFADDEDLFKINEFSEQEEQALRFIFAIKKEYKYISGKINSQEMSLGLV
jgi:hypothetical protein